MQKILQTLLFVVVMGGISVGILIGGDLLTKDLIAANAEWVWKHAILTHHGVAHSETDFVTVFDDTFESESADDQLGTIIRYTATTGRTSFRFSGFGLWDRIEGVITLEPDFVTIVAITVTKQAETPGLGGRVAESAYLSLYVGKKFDEVTGLTIVKTTPQNDSEVDAITGATGTSNAFGGLLNTTYQRYVAAFNGFSLTHTHKMQILNDAEIDFTESNVDAIFESSVMTHVNGNLVLYETSSTVSYRYSVGGAFGGIETLITLEKDFVTIVNVSVLSSSEVWGADVATRSFLDQFSGKKFDPDLIFITGDATLDNEISLDVIRAGATTTRRVFPETMNATYAQYYTAFEWGN